MNYAVIGRDGNFTGAVYTTMTPEINAYHEQYGQSLKLVKGLVEHENEETGEITYSEIQMTIEEAVALKRQQLKAERDYLLQELDPLISNFIRWGDLQESAQSDILAYRLELLDVPQQSDYPQSYTMPTKPDALYLALGQPMPEV